MNSPTEKEVGDASISATSTPRPGTWRWLVAGVSAVAAILVLFAIWPYQHGQFEDRSSVFGGLIYVATQLEDQEWIFCLFVPFIVAFLVWQRRDELASVQRSGGSWWALFPFVASLVLYWIGYKVDTRYFGFASCQLLTAAIILWFFGWPMMRALLFPWVFLAFMWPMLPLEEAMAVPLRITTARVATSFLNILGLDAVRHGTAILSAGDALAQIPEGARFSLDVERPCSGIRSLFSLMMISAFYGSLALDRTWSRAALFLSAIPFAMVGNFVRMVMLAFGSIWFGEEFAIGTNDDPSGYHIGSGLVVFAVALGCMFLFTNILEAAEARFTRQGARKKAGKNTANSPPTSMAPALWRSAGLLALTGTAIVICGVTPVASVFTKPALALDLPIVIGNYAGETLPVQAAERGLLEDGVRLKRARYRSFDGASEFLATSLVSGPVKRSLHRPEVCLPGQGWQIIDRKTIDVPLENGESRRATLLTLMRDINPPSDAPHRIFAFNIYWYEGLGVSAASFPEHILIGHRDNLLKSVNHRWGMLSFFSSLRPQKLPVEMNPINADAKIGQMVEFIGQLAPEVILEPDA